MNIPLCQYYRLRVDLEKDYLSVILDNKIKIVESFYTEKPFSITDLFTNNYKHNLSWDELYTYIQEQYSYLIKDMSWISDIFPKFKTIEIPHDIIDIIPEHWIVNIDKKNISYSTRKNGNVIEGGPSMIDINEAKSIVNKLKLLNYNSTFDVIDEWVYVDIVLP